MKKIGSYLPYLMLLIAITFTACSKDDQDKMVQSNDKQTETNNLYLKKGSDQIVSQAIELLTTNYRVSIAPTDYETKLSVISKDEKKYDVYIFNIGEEQFSASYDIEAEKISFINRFFSINDGVRDINLIDLGSNESITLRAMPIEGNCNDGESCAGCHYRVMKDIISSNGDSQAACDFLDILFVCSAQTYIAATVHCWLNH